MVDLVIGDPHATVEELPDCRRLVELVAEVAFANQVDRIVWLGDQTNSHSVCRVEVLAFWRWAFGLLKSYQQIVLVGNHDLAGDGVSTSMLAFQDMPGVTVVDRPTVLGPTLCLPYLRDPQAFLEACRAHPADVAYCHQTFVGARYENGYPAEDGVDPAGLPQGEFVSGHFHTPQELRFGANVGANVVTYVGGPRWRCKNDANVDRAIWLYRYDDRRIMERHSVDTSAACRKMFHTVDREGEVLPPLVLLDARHDHRVEVYGSKEYVTRRVAEWTAAGARARGFRTDLGSVPEVRESDGVAVAFRRFLDSWTAPRGTPRETLLTMARDRLGVGLVG